MIEFPKQKYKVIYADPPWKFKYQSEEKPGYNMQHYQVMELDEIKALTVNSLAEKDCCLFMWATFPLLDKAFEVMEAWGFEYKTVAFVWVKTNANGTIFKSMGYWTMANAEVCLLATKGTPKRIADNVAQVVMSKREEHSKKPDEVRRRIVQLMGDVSRIELFARQKAYGWDAWGNQVEELPTLEQHF